MDESRQDSEVIRVSGTLDAIAEYVAKEFEFSYTEGAKVVTLLWLEQECELAESARVPEINIALKSLDEFDERAKGMVGNSRIFMNIDRIKAKACRAIPYELVEGMLCETKIKISMISVLLKIIVIAEQETLFIKDGLACVCMKAWQHVRGHEQVPFSINAVMPEQEFERAGTGDNTCQFTREDGRQYLKNAKWECPYHKEGNYCCLSHDRVAEILNCLVQQGVLRSLGNDEYVFL